MGVKLGLCTIREENGLRAFEDGVLGKIGEGNGTVWQTA
jgi:hypothetical protein